MNNNVEVHYDQLGQVAARFQARAEAGAELDRRLRACLEALERGGWIGLGADAFFGEMRGTIIPAMQRFTGALCEAQAVTLEIGELMRRAEEEAARLFQGGANTLAPGGGESGGGGGGGGGGAWGGTPFGLPAWVVSLVKGFDKLKVFDALEGGLMARNLWQAVQQAGKGGGMAKISAIFHGLEEGKGLFDGKGALRKGVSWAGNVVGFAAELVDNWEKYHNESNGAAKIAVGTATDLALIAGGTKLGFIAGGALGSLLGPPGAAIGVPVGGFLGGLVGGWLGEKLGDTELVDGTVGRLVDKAAPVVHDALEQGGRALSTVLQGVEGQARRVDEGLRAVGTTISSMFKPRLAFLGG